MFDKKKALKWLCSGIFLLFFFFFLKNIQVTEIQKALAQISPVLMIFLLLLQVLTQLLLCSQWYLIAKHLGVSSRFSQFFYILSTGSVIEALTPGAKIGGEVTRLYYLKKECDCSTEKATHIILIQKCFSMSVLFGVCLTAFLYLMGRLRHIISPFAQTLLLGLGGFLLLFFLSLLFFPGQVGEKLCHSRHMFLVKLGKLMCSYQENLSKLPKSQWYLQFAISLTVWLLFPVKMMILVRFMDIYVNPVLLIAITMSAYMLALLPLTPGGLGTFEGAIVGLFALIPLGVELSLTIAVLFRLVTFWFVMLMSTIFVLYYRKKGNREKIS